MVNSRYILLSSEFKLSIKWTNKQKAQLEALGLFSLNDIIQNYPYRYNEIKEANLNNVCKDDKVVFEGVIVSVVKHFFKGRITRSSFSIEVDNKLYDAVIFNRRWIASQVGKKLTFFANVQANNKLTITNYNNKPLKEQLGIQPVYRLVADVSLSQYQALIDKALKQDNFIDDLPSVIVEKYNLLDYQLAIKTIHHPKDFSLLTKAIYRLKFQELFLFHYQRLLNKQQLKKNKKSRIFKDIEIKKFSENLDFSLTSDHKVATTEILKDINSNNSMYRLLQGDVGSGKTIVAFIAMYASLCAGYQSVLLAPTELLAKQHYVNALKYFKAEDLVFLSSNCEAQILINNINKIANGSAKIIIGTHKVFQDDIKYYKLGLFIADEQQRFGVKQRQALIDKSQDLDVLQMSATPIPRTIAMSLYADLDVSTLESNINQKKVIYTNYLQSNSFFEHKKQIEELLDQGNLAYIVCAAIEDNQLNTRNVNQLAENLQNHYQNKYKIAVIHSKVDELEQERIMSAFKNEEFNILVSTSIIEVGIDIQDANIMIIYDADRFGLSQLHQLRGRVGRHNNPGYCYLLSNSKDEEVINRLNFLKSNNDGFKIAEYDLFRRGFGELLGTKQSGRSFSNLIDIAQDLQLINDVYGYASEYFKKG
ncbi:MAG: ATP-dependent DNA helicase RecG [Erysipelotrichaceae bacterium]